MAIAPLPRLRAKGVQVSIAAHPEVVVHRVHLEVHVQLRVLQEVLVGQGEDNNSTDESFQV